MNSESKARRFSIKFGFLVVMVMAVVTFGVANPVFLSWSNLFSILLGVTVYAILALGETFPLVITAWTCPSAPPPPCR